MLETLESHSDASQQRAQHHHWNERAALVQVNTMRPTAKDADHRGI